MTPSSSQQKIDIATTNIANLGTDIERKVKYASTGSETAWNSITQDSPGLWVWRIEQFKVVPVPTESIGTFFSGDSYIVLKAYKPAPDSQRLAYNLHFWLGNSTTQDEAGTAAYKTVELDTFLRDDPVQYREIQGHESTLFTSYFSPFIILDGGVESGFRHVDPMMLSNQPTRLLHVKGKGKNLVARQVPCARASLNQGDVFVLDAGTLIIQWNGAKSSAFEKAKAGQVANSLANERMGKCKVIVCDQSTPNADTATFFAKLGGGDGPISEATPDTNIQQNPLSLYCLSDCSGTLTFNHIKTGNITKSDFKTDDTFIIDGGYQIVVWTGKQASPQEKINGVAFAEQFLDKQKRSKLAQVVRVIEGGDCPILDDLIRSQT